MFESELGIKNEELVGMVMNIAKMQLSKVKINFVEKQIEIVDDSKDNMTKLFNRYKTWLNQIRY